MADQNRGSAPNVNSDYKTGLEFEPLKHGHEFSFFQAMRLLRLMNPSGSKSQAFSESCDHIRVVPHLSLGFPASDLEKIEELEGKHPPRYKITANFLSLYGSSSPLPIWYTEELLDEEADGESVSKDFIDIVNQRLFALLFQCWTKYRLHLQVVEAKDTDHMERLFCLLGLGSKPFRKDIPNSYRLLRYIGLFTQIPRSTLGLKTLLSDALNGINVTVIPCIERKAKIPDDQKMLVGSSVHRLGKNAIIGEEIVDRMGKFRIQIGPLNKKQFQQFFPESDMYKDVTFLTDMYVLEPFEYDLEVILAKDEAQTACLGDPDKSRLGLNTWIFSSDTMGEVRTIYTPRRR
jgi:type VI secretion system protein ImpH